MILRTNLRGRLSGSDKLCSEYLAWMSPIGRGCYSITRVDELEYERGLCFFTLMLFYYEMFFYM